MLLPKFSIRLLLLIMVGVAIFATLLTYGMRGNPWLMGVAAGVGSLALVAVVYFVFFLLFGLLAAMLPKRRSSQQAEPPAPRPPMPESSH